MNFTIKAYSFQVLFLVAIIALIGVHVRPVPASPVQSLPVGSYWSGSEIVRRTLQGTGNYEGTWMRDAKYITKFSVVSRDGNTVTISNEYSGSWSSTATGTWVTSNGGLTNHGTIAPVGYDYTINLTTMNITAIKQKGPNSDPKSGNLAPFAWLFIKPHDLREGSTIWIWMWTDSIAPFAVGAPQTVSIRDVNVDVWPLAFSREWRPLWHTGSNSSTGRETITYLYDKSYGVLVGWAVTGSSNFGGDTGNYTATRSDDFRVSDTNIHFTQLSGSVVSDCCFWGLLRRWPQLITIMLGT